MNIFIFKPLIKVETFRTILFIYIYILLRIEKFYILNTKEKILFKNMYREQGKYSLFTKVWDY
jgi:hypothetical protein